ncbi:MAG: FG-GAP repeat domain-containing protein, partial [Promethearchaeota archaeon]
LTPIFRYRLMVGNNPSKLMVGDVNNDGELDIVVANFDDSNVSIFCWNESMNIWNSELTLDVGHKPSGLSIGDVNNDGAQDIVTSTTYVGSNNVSIILWNKQQKKWDPVITRQISDSGTTDVVVADANNDGANDIIASLKSPSWPPLSIILWNKTQKDWDPYFKIVGLSDRFVFDIEVEDINNDGFNDLIGAGWGYPTRYIGYRLWNSTTLTWDDWKDVFHFVETPPHYTTPFAIGDATNDGKKDLVTVQKVQNKISIYAWNTTLQGWNPPITKPIANEPNSVDVGDINNDGFNDIVTSNNRTTTGVYGRVAILLWNAIDQDWEPQETHYTMGDFPKSVIIQDVTDDNMNDITVFNHQNKEISVIPFNRYPFILSRTALQTDPKWVQDEDFETFSIPLTKYEADLGELHQNLTWYIENLDSSLVNVSGEYSTDDVLTFNSIPNMNGNDTFELYLQDRYGSFFRDKVLITLIINPVNDVPIILNKENIRNNSIWVQSIDTDSFQINLTAHEFDVEDSKSALIWFTIGLDEKIITVEGENSTNDILTFYPKNIGTDNFSLILMDSRGAYDSLTITIKITAGLTRILVITISSVALGITAIFIERYRIKRRDTRTRRLKPSKKKLKRQKITQNSTSET